MQRTSGIFTHSMCDGIPFGLREERLLGGEGEVWLLRGGAPVFHRAVEAKESFFVRVRLPRRLGTVALSLLFLTDEGEVIRYAMTYCGIADGGDIYECRVAIDVAGLYFYCFLGEGTGGSFYGMRSASGQLGFSRTAAAAHFQLTVTEEVYPAPAWLYGGIIYHIFVDRFARGGRVPRRADAILRTDWEGATPAYPAERGGHLENNEFFGGTLFGIAARMGRLASLGVSCLYLSPILEAYSNHKYDTGCYERVDAMLGGERGLASLLRAAERYGIRVILDGVFNHTGSDSVYFNKRGRYATVGAYQSSASPYYRWYRFTKHPDEYECWWGIDTLPRLDPEEPSLRRYLTGEGGIVERYARLGIAGLRLDVVDELSDGFVRDIKARLCSVRGDALLLGEVWEDASHKVAYGIRKSYYTGRELDGVMNYPLRSGLISFLREGECRPLREALLEVLPNMPKRVADGTMNLLGSHDTERILTALAGEREEGQPMEALANMRLDRESYQKGCRLLVLGYLALATLPGVPSIFYGDEVGVQGYRDPLNRRPYPWKKQDKALFSAFREIGRMRRACHLLREGSFRLLLLTGEFLIFSRSEGNAVLLTVINRGERGVRLHFKSGVRCLYGGAISKLRPLVAARSGAVLLTSRQNRFRLIYDDGSRFLDKM